MRQPHLPTQLLFGKVLGLKFAKFRLALGFVIFYNVNLTPKTSITYHLKSSNILLQLSN
jgi:hypothetical protein